MQGIMVGVLRSWENLKKHDRLNKKRKKILKTNKKNLGRDSKTQGKILAHLARQMEKS